MNYTVYFEETDLVLDGLIIRVFDPIYVRVEADVHKHGELLSYSIDSIFWKKDKVEKDLPVLLDKAMKAYLESPNGERQLLSLIHEEILEDVQPPSDREEHGLGKEQLL